MKHLLPFFMILSSCQTKGVVHDISEEQGPQIELADLKAALIEDEQKTLADLNTALKNSANQILSCSDSSDCSLLGLTPLQCGSFSEFILASRYATEENGPVKKELGPSEDYNKLRARVLRFQTRVKASWLAKSVGICTVAIPEAPLGYCSAENKCEIRSRSDALSSPP